MIFEVRRQFRDDPGIMAGTSKARIRQVVDIVTRDSLRELVTPGLLAVLTPDRRGLRPRRRGAAGSFLAGTIAAGTLMACSSPTPVAPGTTPRSSSRTATTAARVPEPHEATVIGDTVGDPFKDTAGPAINPLIRSRTWSHC